MTFIVHLYLWFNYFYFCSSLELRQLRDKSCKERWEHQRPISCSGRLFARYDIRHTADSVRNWRCYYEDALIRDRSRYDTTKRSNCYHTDSELESFTSEGECKDMKLLLQYSNCIMTDAYRF